MVAKRQLNAGMSGDFLLADYLIFKSAVMRAQVCVYLLFTHYSANQNRPSEPPFLNWFR